MEVPYRKELLKILLESRLPYSEGECLWTPIVSIEIDGNSMKAHRALWELHNDRRLYGRSVTLTCGTRNCMNLRHMIVKEK